MNELIKVTKTVLNSIEQDTVSARSLHEFLGVGRDFSTWIKGRIAEYSFLETLDFTVPQNGGTDGMRVPTEYLLSWDMAKELSMLEKTPKGREARKYFIECEKRLHSKPAVTTDPTQTRLFRDFVSIGVLYGYPEERAKEIALCLVEYAKTLTPTELPSVNALPMHKLPGCDRWITAQEVMEIYGMSAKPSQIWELRGKAPNLPFTLL